MFFTGLLSWYSQPWQNILLCLEQPRGISFLQHERGLTLRSRLTSVSIQPERAKPSQAGSVYKTAVIPPINKGLLQQQKKCIPEKQSLVSRASALEQEGQLRNLIFQSRQLCLGAEQGPVLLWLLTLGTSRQRGRPFSESIRSSWLVTLYFI